MQADRVAAHTAEARLLQAGAGVDVIGMRAWQLSASTRSDVLRRYPMLNFIDGLADFSAESHPGTRTRLLLRWLRFATLARHSPLLGGG